ncbi:hypothetical protein A4X06_0g9504 [Tilletia controversa]|uniref:Gamma interferon inducible lysosomal thiol reductase n=1 Tax=Tilletia controversa TaxID=13291 RepID=A0A8X7MIB6_9BASI|nr:hypothetical protein CF328_g9125 [Tilletia controversa]KAE8236581.1 hypothetical protein A4X06_0g9504 [Tilletia controversa]
MVKLTLAATALVAIATLYKRAAAIPATHLPDLQRPFFTDSSADNDNDAPTPHPLSAPRRVEITAGVMSRCPDALYCESTLDRILDRLNPKIKLHLTYLGTPNASSPLGAECLHGPDECKGNIHQLCVQDALRPSRAGKEFDLSPSAAQLKWFDIVQCMNYAKNNIGQESLLQDCLKTVKGGPSWDGPGGIAECVQGEHGRKLLLDSFAESKKLGIVNSCTIIIEGGAQCVRDGGLWKRCTVPGGHEVGDFVAEIEQQWARINNGSESA